MQISVKQMSNMRKANIEAAISEAGSDEAMGRAVSMLRELIRRGGFDDVTFERVWALLRTVTASND